MEAKNASRRNAAPLFERVVIVGPGLIGGSLGAALKSANAAGRVVGVGRRAESLDLALEMGAVDEGTLDLGAAVPKADLVVLATSVGKICEQAGVVIPRMKPGAILTDVGSVKRVVCDAVTRAFAAHPDAGVRFVGSHPLCGSEQRGIRAARGDLYQEAVCVLTPTPETDPEALSKVRAMWEIAGCRVVEFPPDLHDRLLAQVSHLPHAVAACLVNAVSDEAFDLAATGFMDTTRVASGDPTLWRDVCMMNRPALAEALRAFSGELKAFADALEGGNGDALASLFSSAKTRRDARLHPRP